MGFFFSSDRGVNAIYLQVFCFTFWQISRKAKMDKIRNFLPVFDKLVQYPRKLKIQK